ncbi:MAG: amidohydrolase [Oscillospiraceae bacterium]|jgi:5-methylthioadenosine/S-adenosylhomocysteine deaminase|nr:amidohydrolase [Oscillospiraceae bacterium]
MLFKNIDYCDENFTVRRGNIAVRGDAIVSVSAEPPRGDFGEVIDGGGRLLLPGLVNAHCHVPMTLLRGYGEGLPLDRWLNERVYPFEDLMTDEDAYWAGLLGIAEMLACGVTSFSDLYNFCESIAEAVKVSGIRANLSRGLVSFDGGALRDSFRFAEAVRLIDGWHGAENGRILVDASIHAEYTSHEGFVRDLAAYAKERGVGVHIHLSETKKEHGECVANRGVTPAEYFARAGVFDSRVTAAHCVHVTDSDMELLRQYNVTAVHCPSSNLKLGSGVAPIPKLLEKGVNVALGTDGASSNNNLNLFEELHLAAMLHRGAAMNPSLLPPAETLKIATANGAAAQGRGDTGVIREGYKADFAVLSLNKPHLTPVHDLLSDAVFAAQGSDVELTVVDGKILYRDGKFLTFDVSEAMEKSAAAARRIADSLRQSDE